MSAVPDSRITELFVENIPEPVWRTMTFDQKQAVREAFARLSKRSSHAIDVRFVLPLIFTQLYVVLLVGRDRRRKTADVELERRRKLGGFAFNSTFLVLVVLFSILAFLALYTLKSAFGIDLFTWHLQDLWR